MGEVDIFVQSVEIVLTAHPTQVLRRSLQHKQCRISQLLHDLDSSSAPATASKGIFHPPPLPPSLNPPNGPPFSPSSVAKLLWYERTKGSIRRQCRSEQ